MITEDYCSYEVAKLLKEKGFDAECRAAYTNYGKLFTTQIQQYVTNVLCSKGYLWDCVAPTHQMAMKWLREVHNIYMEIAPTHSINGLINFIWQTYDSDYLVTGDCDIFYPTYEEAVEAVIKYCLENLI